MDEALGSKLERIIDLLETLAESDTGRDTLEIRYGVERMADDVAEIRSQLGSIKTEVEDIARDVSSMQFTLESVHTDLVSVRSDMSSGSDTMDKVDLHLTLLDT